MIRFAVPLIALALAAIPVTSTSAQTYTAAEQAAMARIEAETPLVHAMMIATGRYDNIVQTHGFWLDTMGDYFFSDAGPAMWETQIAEALTSDRIMDDFAAEVADLPVTSEVITASRDFFGTELAQRFQAAETNTGQIRIRDDAQYDQALAAYQEIAGTQDPRALMITRMEEVFQSSEFLLDRGHDEEFAFLQGLRAEGFYLDEMSDDDLREIMDYDRDAAHAGADDYYRAYRMMLFDVFTLEEMSTYVDFFDSPEGRVFSDFTRTGSDAMVWAYRYEVGRVMAPIWIAEWEAEQAPGETTAPVAE